MNNSPRDIIQQADLLIRNEKYESAWHLLLPIRDNPNARKRLIWLKRKQNQLKQSPKIQKPLRRRSRRFAPYLIVFLFAILGITLAVIFRSSWETTNPAIQSQMPTQVGISSMATQPSIIVETNVPPTEPVEEVDLQQQLHIWFASIEGVNKIQSLDIDMPENDLPLVYAEIGVIEGFNDTRIPNTFVEKLKTTLNSSHYSDFVIIINDGTRLTEYNYDSERLIWRETELINPAPTANQSN